MDRTGVAAVIMAGGRSERMRAGGSPQHKALRTVLGLPLIERNLRALLWFGFRDLFVAVSAREEALGAWLDGKGRALADAEGATLTRLVETQPLGTIGAVAALPKAVEQAVVVNVDNLTAIDLAVLLEFHQAHGAAATIACHDQPFPIPFGMLEREGERVVAYREKPSVPVPISSGCYALHRRAIDRVPPGVRTDVPALIATLLEAGEPVCAWTHQEPWIDVNDEAALARAQGLFAGSARPWLGEASGSVGGNRA